MKYMVKSIRKPNLQCAAVIAVLFLLTSTAYMAWTYHIVELAAVPVSDVVTLVASYLFQAVGIGLFSVLLRRGEELIRKTIYIALCLHLFFLLCPYSARHLRRKLLSAVCKICFADGLQATTCTALQPYWRKPVLPRYWGLVTAHQSLFHGCFHTWAACCTAGIVCWFYASCLPSQQCLLSAWNLFREMTLLMYRMLRKMQHPPQ